MNRMISALAMIAVLVVGGATTTSWAQSGYEAEPVLSAKDLVSPEARGWVAFGSFTIAAER